MSLTGPYTCMTCCLRPTQVYFFVSLPQDCFIVCDPLCELSILLRPLKVPASLHRRGQACMIPGTREFFIALVDHDEWGGAHTVWGEVSTPSLPQAVGVKDGHTGRASACTALPNMHDELCG